MAKARKTLLKVGEHHARQGVLKVNAARAQRYADNINEMTKLGIKLPLCWSHHPSVLPDTAYDLARLNAGYYSDAKFDAKSGILDIEVDAPGCELDKDTGNLTTWTKLPDGREVKTAIGEVSGHIKDWTDGQGRVWKDSCVHVALVPLPVVTDQGGFTELATGTEPTEFFLSLSTWKADLATMPEEKEKKAPPSEEAPKAKEEPDYSEEEADDEPSNDAPADIPKLPEIPEGQAAFAPALKALQSLLPPPDDTTPENGWERIVVACHALEHANAQAAQQTPAPGQTNNQVSPEPANNQGVVEEGRPIMLSTMADGQLKKLLTDRQERDRTSGLKRLDALAKKLMPVFEVNALRDKISGYELSLVGEEVKTPPWEWELAIWEKTLDYGKGALKRHMKGAKEQTSPMAGVDRTKEQEEIGDEIAALAGAPVKKK